MVKPARADLLVAASELAERIGSPDLIVFDCRFDLADPDAGRRAWREGHIAGAVYAHLDDDLAAPVTAGSGRHPLPDPEVFAAFLARSGWRPGRRVVAYDAHGGAFAARLWWLMRYFGHDVAALLDGGLPAWVEAGFELEHRDIRPAPEPAVELVPEPGAILDTAGVSQALKDGAITLMDARARDRFEGRNETIDPVAGHVPGAVSQPFSVNLTADDSFRAPEELARKFARTRQTGDAGEVVHMCGSGVTACHNLLAMELAGLTGSRLYPGSWSEWIRDPSRPVAKGPG